MTGLCPHCGYDLVRDEPVAIGEAHYDPLGGLQYKGDAVRLPPAQRIIVGTLMKAGGKPITFDALIGRLGIDSDGAYDIVRTQVCRLRAMLRPLGGARHVQSVWGVGYRWAA